MSAIIGDYIYSTDYIAKGNFSKVFKCFSNKEDKLFAIKIIEKNKLKSVFLKRMEREITLLTKLKHPNILRSCLLLSL